MYTIKHFKTEQGETEIWLTAMTGQKVSFIGKYNPESSEVDTPLGAGQVQLLEDGAVVASTIEVSAMMHEACGDLAL